MKARSVVSIALSLFGSFLLGEQTTPAHINLYTFANFIRRRDPKRAFELYQELFKTNPPIHVYGGYIHLLHDTGNTKHILALLPKLDEPFADDKDIQLIFAQELEKAGRHNEAATRYISLSKKFPEHQEITYYAAAAYVKKGDLHEALEVIDTYLETSTPRQNNFIFYFLKSQIFLQLNNIKEATKNINKSLELYPRFDKGWLFLGLLMEQQGKLQDAINGYQRFLEISGGDKAVEQQLTNLLMRKQRLEGATAPAAAHQEHTQLFKEAMQAYEDKRLHDAHKLVDRCLRIAPADTSCRLLKVEVLSAADRYNDAVTTVQQWITEQPYDQSWYRIAHLLFEAGTDKHRVIKMLEQVDATTEKNIWAKLYLADLNTRNNNLPRALRYHHEALDLIKDRKIRAKIRFQIAAIHYERREWHLVEKTLEQELDAAELFPPVLNLLAFTYAQQRKKLDEATALMQRALKALPKNPHFIDTQAYILYKKKDYQQAHTLLQPLAQQLPHDHYVQKHMAKTLYQLGKKADAITTLKQAHQHTTDKRKKAHLARTIEQWEKKSKQTTA